MTRTPRTDAEAFQERTERVDARECVDAEFARHLERDLAIASHAVDALLALKPWAVSTGAACRINCPIKKHAEIMATALQSEFDHPHPIVVEYMKELDRK